MFQSLYLLVRNWTNYVYSNTQFTHLVGGHATVSSRQNLQWRDNGKRVDRLEGICGFKLLQRSWDVLDDSKVDDTWFTIRSYEIRVVQKVIRLQHSNRWQTNKVFVQIPNHRSGPSCLLRTHVIRHTVFDRFTNDTRS